MRVVWLVAAAGTLLVAVVAFLVSWALRNDEPMQIPEDGVEGVTTHGLRWVEVGARVRGAGRSWHTRPLLREVQGARDFDIGGVGFRVDDPMEQLRGWSIRSKRFDSLDEVPEAARIPGWQEHDGPGGFYVSELSVEPGEPVTLELATDGSPIALWRGGLEDLQGRRDRVAAQGAGIARFLRGLGAISLVVCLFCLGRAIAAE